MMSTISDSYIHQVLSKVALACGLEEWSHTRQNFENIAQNYFGVLIPVLLSGKLDGKHLNIHLVLKLAPTDDRYRISGAVTAMFAREIFVYSELLKCYRDIQDKLNPRSDFVMPRCYYVCREHCEEAIAMQNMCEDGYKPFTESIFLDLDHVTVALKALAKFHALSFILNKTDRIMYDKAKNVCVPFTNETNNRFMTILLDRLTKALNKFEGTTYITLLQELKNNCEYLIESAVHSVKNTCLCHGDIWKENILFKYKDNVPIEACIIDYQTTRLCSPAYDILYLIISSHLITHTDTNLRQTHFRNLIDLYYETFSKSIWNANLDVGDIYMRQDLDDDLRTVSPACLIVVNTAIWLSSGLQQEGHVRSKHILVTEDDKLNADNQYKTRIKGIIEDMYSYGYLRISESLK